MQDNLGHQITVLGLVLSLSDIFALPSALLVYVAVK